MAGLKTMSFSLSMKSSRQVPTPASISQASVRKRITTSSAAHYVHLVSCAHIHGWSLGNEAGRDAILTKYGFRHSPPNSRASFQEVLFGVWAFCHGIQAG
jgi:hypothetical protein